MSKWAQGATCQLFWKTIGKTKGKIISEEVMVEVREKFMAEAIDFWAETYNVIKDNLMPPVLIEQHIKGGCGAVEKTFTSWIQIAKVPDDYTVVFKEKQ